MMYTTYNNSFEYLITKHLYNIIIYYKIGSGNLLRDCV